MARGWESKEVESQIEAAETRAAEASKIRLSAEQISRQRQLESLQLSRTRVLQDMESSKNPRYLDMLLESLNFLDQKIAALKDS